MAIVTIGGLLRTKNRTIQEWETVSCSLNEVINTDETLNRMKKVLLISYNQLPHHLKSCFLYLSIFPEDLEEFGLESGWPRERQTNRG